MSEDPENGPDGLPDAPQDAMALIGYDIVKAVAIARDPEALDIAYRKLFGSVEGKAVLFDLMDTAHTLGERRPDMGALERAHRDGMVDLAARIFDRAGVSTLERIAGLQAASAINTHMERAHGRRNSQSPSPDDGPDGRPVGGPNDTDLHLGGDEHQFD